MEHIHWNMTYFCNKGPLGPLFFWFLNPMVLGQWPLAK